MKKFSKQHIFSQTRSFESNSIELSAGRLLFNKQWIAMIGIFGMLIWGMGCSSGTTQNETNQGQNTKDKVVRPESATTGEIHIGADQTLEPIARQIASAFENMHPKATINVHYRPEVDLFTEFLQDSFRVIISGRDFSPAEASFLRREKIIPKTTILGLDAIVMVMNPENPHDSLTRSDLEKIVRGKVTTWEELGTGQSGPIELVFDDERSGVILMMQQMFAEEGDTIFAKAYAAKGHDDLVDYVSKSPQAIGFIGASWVSDRDHPQVRSYLKKIKLAWLESPDTSDIPREFVRPYQNEIALSRYPFTRKFYILNREHFSGLGTGFVIYAAGEHGQRIILKSGLYPEFPPPRLVVFPELEN